VEIWRIRRISGPKRNDKTFEMFDDDANTTETGHKKHKARQFVIFAK
jgi:hypothetical protein